MPYATTKAMNNEYIDTPVHSCAMIIEIELMIRELFTTLTVPFPIMKRRYLIIKTKKFMKKLFIGPKLKNQLSKRKTPKNFKIKNIDFFTSFLSAIFLEAIESQYQCK